MDRRHRLESLRRSLACLQPGAPGLSREQAIALVEDFQRALDVIEQIRAELRRLADEKQRPGRSVPPVSRRR